MTTPVVETLLSASRNPAGTVPLLKSRFAEPSTKRKGWVGRAGGGPRAGSTLGIPRGADA
jgi:hypothetical protein